MASDAVPSSFLLLSCGERLFQEGLFLSIDEKEIVSIHLVMSEDSIDIKSR